MTTLSIPELEIAKPPAPRESLLGPKTGELTLRISGGPQAGRVVRLKSSKCTIGSAADCTLRIRGEGIDPLHCLILHGSANTVVRRWSYETLLNDRRFEDAPLRRGDRLSLGPVELQVVSLPHDASETTETPRRLEREAAELKLRVDRLSERLRLANRQARHRVQAVIGKLRKLRMRHAEFEGRKQNLCEEGRRLAELELRLAERGRDLQARIDEFERRQSSLNAQEKLLEEQGERLRGLAKQWNLDRTAAQESLESRRAELEAQTAAFTAQVAAAERRLLDAATREAEIVRREAEFAAAAADLEARRKCLESERAEIARQAEDRRCRAVEAEQRLSQREDALDRQERALAERVAELERTRDRFAADQLEIEEAHVRAAAESASRCEAELAERQSRFEAECEIRRTELAAKQAEIERRAEEVASRCDALKRHWNELVERERKLQASETERANDAPQDSNARVEAAANAAAADIERLNRALGDREADLAAAAQRLESLQDAVRKHAEQQELSDVNAAAAEARAEELGRDLDAIRSQHQALEQTFAALESKNQTLAAERDQWREQFEATCRRMEAIDAELDTLRTAATTTTTVEAEEVESCEPEVAAETLAAPDSEVDCRLDEVNVVESLDHTVQLEADDAGESVADVGSVETTCGGDSCSPAQPESAAEVLRRMGLDRSLTDDVEESTPLAERLVESSPKGRGHSGVAGLSTVAESAGEQPSEDEASLNAYMSQLFQRLGVKQTEPVATSRAPQAATVSSARADSPAAVAPTVETPPTPQAPLTAAEFKARSVAAERGTDLSALRELANTTAKAAISKHQINASEKASRWKRVAAMLSLGVSGAGAWLQWHGLPEALPIIAAGVIGAAWFSVQSLGLKRRVKTTARTLDDVLQKSTGKSASRTAEEQA